MQFGISFADAGPFTFPDALTHLARTAEAAGIESLWSVEHVVIPVGYKSTYAYDRSGRIPAPESLPLPAAAARLRRRRDGLGRLHDEVIAKLS